MSVYSPWHVRGWYDALGSSPTAGPGSLPREACRRVGNVAVRMRMHHTTFLLAAAAAAIAIATAPSASAAPSGQPCSGGGNRPTVKDRATCRSTPRFAPCLGFSPTPTTRSGLGWDITRGGRRLGITRSGRLLGMTRNTAGFSLDLPFCGLRNLLSLRTFGAPRRRRQHVHPGIPMPRTRVARPHTRRGATRRSPLRSGWRRSRPPSRSTCPWLAPPRTRVA